MISNEQYLLVADKRTNEQIEKRKEKEKSKKKGEGRQREHSTRRNVFDPLGRPIITACSDH